MSLLIDKDIISLVDQKDPIIKDLQKPRDWYHKDSPVQPTSVDLHIGNIYLPGTKKDDPGGVEKPLDQHILPPGHTAVVVTLEELIIPNNIAGIGFPPARVSFKGILMTNPGHVDAGYNGPMHFTIINMGRENYVLEKGKEIVTMLFFNLSEPVKKDWLERRDGKSVSPLKQESLNRLCSDFMDVDRRAKEISNKAVNRADIKIKRASVLVPIVAALVTVVLGGIFNWVVPAWREPLNKVQTDIAVLDEKLNISDIKDRIKEIEQRQNKFEEKFQNDSNSQATRTEKNQTDKSIASPGGKE